jgi:2-polyprenyl-3-methyl-5-hydroxy-6-metoxy-1,4-benzoquinol methylase
MPKNGDFQRIYGKNYFFSGKEWNDGYPNYECFSTPSKHPWGFMVPKILEKRQKGRILDIGCALGHFLSFFPDSFEKFGTDISEFAIESAKRKFPSCEFAVGDISAAKPFNKQFDVITAFDVLEHTLNLRSALQNIHAMLRDNGFLVVGVPVASRLHHLLAFLGKSFLTTMDSHITLTTAKAWREIILPERFQVVEEFPLTWAGKHYPRIDLFHVFFLRKH